MENNITKEEFEAYEEVRVSGATNMFNIRMVESLSGLEIDTIKDIMKNYSHLKEKYGN